MRTEVGDQTGVPGRRPLFLEATARLSAGDRPVTFFQGNFIHGGGPLRIGFGDTELTLPAIKCHRCQQLDDFQS